MCCALEGDRLLHPHQCLALSCSRSTGATHRPSQPSHPCCRRTTSRPRCATPSMHSSIALTLAACCSQVRGPRLHVLPPAGDVHGMCVLVFVSASILCCYNTSASIPSLTHLFLTQRLALIAFDDLTNGVDSSHALTWVCFYCNWGVAGG